MKVSKTHWEGVESTELFGFSYEVPRLTVSLAFISEAPEKDAVPATVQLAEMEHGSRSRGKGR